MLGSILKRLLDTKLLRHFCDFWVNQVTIFLNLRNIFVSSPRWFFISSPVGFVGFPVENLLLRLNSENFWKFDIFPGHSSSPHRDTKTGCIHKENLTAEQMFIQNIY